MPCASRCRPVCECECERKRQSGQGTAQRTSASSAGVSPAATEPIQRMATRSSFARGGVGASTTNNSDSDRDGDRYPAVS